jgi:hypothetical protein
MLRLMALVLPDAGSFEQRRLVQSSDGSEKLASASAGEMVAMGSRGRRW